MRSTLASGSATHEARVGRFSPHGVSRAIVLAGVLCILAGAMDCARAQTRWQSLYATTNLAGHNIAFEQNPGLGYGPACSTQDVALTVYPQHGAVTANTRQTNLFVNAIGYRKFISTFPNGAPIALQLYQYSGQVRIPVVPQTNPVQTQNAQCVQMMIQLWDGSDRLWTNRKTSLEATVYWDLGPWGPDFQKVKVYTTENGALKLVDTGLLMPADTNWHSVEAVVDLANRKWVSVCCDSARVDLSGVGLAYVSHPEWGDELALSITTESMHSFPGTNFSRVFQWTTEYKNLDLSRLDFKAGVDRADGGTRIDLWWDSEPFVKYRVLSSPDLSGWAVHTNIWIGSGAKLSYTQPTTGTTHNFYRLRIDP